MVAAGKYFGVGRRGIIAVSGADSVAVDVAGGAMAWFNGVVFVSLQEAGGSGESEDMFSGKE